MKEKLKEYEVNIRTEVKLSLLIDNMIIYLEISRELYMNK